MNIPAEFDEIRPYLPEELPQIFEELIADPTFQDIMTRIIPDVPVEILCAKLRQCKTNLEVQKTFSTSCFMTSWISIVTDSTWTPHL